MTPRLPVGSTLGARRTIALSLLLAVGVAAVGTAVATVAHPGAPGQGLAQQEAELVDGEVYEYGTVLFRSEGVAPNEVVIVQGVDDAGNELFLNATASADGVLRIDTAEAFPDAEPPAELEVNGEDGTPALSFGLEATSGATTTVPPSDRALEVFVEPQQVTAGGTTQVVVSGGTPDGRAVLSVGDLGPERIIELFEEGRPQYNESYERPTVPLDGDGQWEGILRVHEGVLEPGRSYQLGVRDIQSGQEAGTELQVVAGDGTPTGTTVPGVETTRDEDAPPATAVDTPARGFLVNGADGPLAPVANMLNLTMIGFILSVFGILYQLMEGR